MAHTARQTSQRLNGAAALALKARLRHWLAQPGAARLAKGFARAQWRPLRLLLAPLLARGDIAAVLQALTVALQARRSSVAAAPPPVAWTLPEALAALQTSDADIQLFGALRLLQAAQPDKQRLGYATNPDREAVRIDQALLTGFAPREVMHMALPRAGQTAARASISQNAVGLLGPNGPLPYTWTQHALDLQAKATHVPADQRQSFVAFLNVVQRRQLALLYRAWSDAQAVVALDTSADPDASHPISDRLRALAGLAHAPLLARDEIPAGFKLAFAAALSRRVHSPGPLADLLARYFDAPVRIDEFAARWLPIPSAQQSRLGAAFAVLGHDAVAGARVWDCSTRFRVTVGPLSLARYQGFLPGGLPLRQLRDLVALYAGPEWEWEFCPVLRANEVPRACLGATGLQLGWTSWLGQRPAPMDAQDLRLTLTPSLTGRQVVHPAEHGAVQSDDTADEPGG